jgi:hypothetical protein
MIVAFDNVPLEVGRPFDGVVAGKVGRRGARRKHDGPRVSPRGRRQAVALPSTIIAVTMPNMPCGDSACGRT